MKFENKTRTVFVGKLMSAGVVGGLMLTTGLQSAMAQSATMRVRDRRPAPPSRVVNPIVQPTVGGGYAIATSVVGSWTGTMNHSGDDVIVHTELTLSANGQGSWRYLGAENVVLASGQVAYTVDNNQISLSLTGGNSPMQLEGTLQNADSRMTGSVQNSNMVFQFNKG